MSEGQDGNGFEAYQMLEGLEENLPENRKVLFHNYFLGVLSEVNYLLNEIFWSFFSRGRRRRQFLDTIDRSKRRFWLDNPDPGHMIPKPLDCLGKRNFLEGLKIYFEERPDKKEHLNHHLRMRFLIFYETYTDFLDAIERLCKLRNYLAHPGPDSKLSVEELRNALLSLCYLVHPVFFGLLKSKVREFARGLDFECFVDETFEKMQKNRRDQIGRERKRFSGVYRTRRSQGRGVTRAQSQFENKWDKKRREWGSDHRLWYFIYQYNRINPEAIKKLACQRYPPCQDNLSFGDVERLHYLFSALDLLLWEYLPWGRQAENRKVADLRNCLAHNEKMGANDNRCFKKEFGILRECLPPIRVNDFYTQAESILKKQNCRRDKNTGARVHFGEEHDKDTLENPKTVRRVVASIKRDLNESWKKTGID